MSELKPWFKNVNPHTDIREGKLDESIFAANLAEVSFGNGREIYQNPDIFFKKTFFTAGIKNIVKKVIKGLNGKQDSENRVISLQTGFGGGKTHSLISLYHIIKARKSISNNTDLKKLIDYTGVPTFSNANIAVFTNKTNDPTQGREVNGLNIKTLWGGNCFSIGRKRNL